MQPENTAIFFLILIGVMILWCGFATILMLKGYAKYPEDNL